MALNLTPADEQKVEATGNVVPGNATQTPYFVSSASSRDGERDRHKHLQGQEGVRWMQAQTIASKKAEGIKGSAAKVQEEQEGRTFRPKDTFVGYAALKATTSAYAPRSLPCYHPSSSSGSNTVPLPPSAVSTNTSDPSNGGERKSWGRSTMPLPAGLPTKPTFAQHPTRKQMIPVGPPTAGSASQTLPLPNNSSLPSAPNPTLSSPKVPSRTPRSTVSPTVGASYSSYH